MSTRWQRVVQAMAECGEAARRANGSMEALVAVAAGKEWRCATDSRGVTRVQTRRPR